MGGYPRSHCESWLGPVSSLKWRILQVYQQYQHLPRLEPILKMARLNVNVKEIIRIRETVAENLHFILSCFSNRVQQSNPIKMAADPWHHFQEGPGSKLLCCFKPFVGSLSFNKLLWPINRRLRKDNAHYLQLSGTARNKNTEKIITNSTSWRKQFNQAPRPPLAGDWGVVVKILRRTWRQWKSIFM